jgi:hypothetical protein
MVAVGCLPHIPLRGNPRVRTFPRASRSLIDHLEQAIFVELHHSLPFLRPYIRLPYVERHHVYRGQEILV